MQLTELSIQSQNPFVRDYINGKKEMEPFFDYGLSNESWSVRLDDLSSRTYDRDALADYLLDYHSKFQSASMNETIERLRDPKSVVVVGGQQAGLLTGPLYTIHKIVSILVFAKQKEQELNVPVIPVFWVAGEDHDLEEINHVHISDGGKVKKHKLPQSHWKKSQAAKTALDAEKAEKWLDGIFASFEETEYTKDLLSHLRRCLRQSLSFTDFFEWLVADMFAQDGLILLNSGDPGIRALEARFFRQLLNKNDELTDSVKRQQEFMKQLGYTPIIEGAAQHANLFYEHDGERFLIEKENGAFFIKELHLQWSEAELCDLICQKPEAFSNNVVTRPLMQEYLLPTLAFIAGPGEINYWGELKGAFQVMGYKMPPVVPRLQVTFLERHIEKKLGERGIELRESIEKGARAKKEQYFEDKVPSGFTDSVKQAKEKIENVHSAVRAEALEIDGNLGPLLEKNAGFIQDQLEFLEKTVIRRIEEKENYILRDFDKIQTSIKPLDAPQERIWNIVYYLNKYGPNFLEKYKDLPYSFQNMHQVVKL
ncbi:bacillithiol biosynthesis cysteine-adding enzyme BshC [Bacillus haynesii]|uniref:Putative cysteine ligase BshC n=2 Tax=Bacillus haynesii TaxID=1925021 RepID=A0AA90E0Y6_9BACI|nr:bacillithiol biosynthesis cysteine-adding enzyme BshC [Bacillus haynesii]MCY7860759.1 bacillithiol biosynthesis cysteine-adding enzyme BshC [Bacillus haynesii]MCY8003108.1 bacillithiol biosynthesis cysteine-adding enzyme BshC [Bacillus haynesii]MCY8067321.1 bacillithiol biosynthesis cysteine-adding enzyme BshC [Bacillus haynesii]MCY8560784.1 bacillithiol biosynthesis cysteine-adding enzyme BshC [Bacillus haynesii]MCY9153037.1 bacillithiol biosynthesis cysteine-adding enzyme BshC [Bacillus h